MIRPEILIFPSLVLAVISLSACGKVNDPLPPIVDIPEPVADLTVSQTGYDLRFEWTNPQFHVDRTSASRLTRALIRADGEVLLDVPVSNGPGKRESAILRNVRSQVGIATGFSIEVAGGRERFSSPSPPVSLTLVEVPGPVSSLAAVVDEGRITLAWLLPQENGDMVEGYRVYRSNTLLAELPGDRTGFSDERYVQGETYAYRVVAIGSGPRGTLEGVAASDLLVDAVDVTPPDAPVGLGVRQVDGGVLLTWPPLRERDLAGYRVFRFDSANGTFTPLHEGLLPTTGYEDAAWREGAAYAVSGVDRSGNESPPSDPVF